MEMLFGFINTQLTPNGTDGIFIGARDSQLFVMGSKRSTECEGWGLTVPSQPLIT